MCAQQWIFGRGEGQRLRPRGGAGGAEGWRSWGRTTWRWPAWTKAAELRRAGTRTAHPDSGPHPAGACPGALLELGLTQTVLDPWRLAGALSRAAGSRGDAAESPPQAGHRHEPPGLFVRRTTDPERRRPGGGRSVRPARSGGGGNLHPLCQRRRGRGATPCSSSPDFWTLLAALEDRWTTGNLQFAIARPAQLCYTIPVPIWTWSAPASPSTATIRTPPARGWTAPRLLPVMALKSQGGRRAGPARRHPGELRLHRAVLEREAAGWRCCPWAMPTDCPGCCPINGRSGWPGGPRPHPGPGVHGHVHGGRWTDDAQVAAGRRGGDLWFPACRRRSRPSWRAPSSMSCCAPSLPGCPGCTWAWTAAVSGA